MKKKQEEIKVKPKLPKFDPFCPKCDISWIHKNNVSHVFCADCGTKLIQQAKCKICGEITDGYWKYCATCGVEIVRQEG